MLFVRVAQNWASFLQGISRARLVELNQGSTSGLPESSDPVAVEKFLEQVGVDLSKTKSWYQRLGGDAGADVADSVTTNFTGLKDHTLDQLAAHAAWQVHAAFAIYGI